MTKNFQCLNTTLVHQLKKKIEELNDEKEKLKVIFDNANDGILIADIENKKFYIGNRAICKMLGYSLSELKNLGILDIHPKKDLPYVMSQFKLQSAKEIDIAKNIPVKRKDGNIFYADINSSPITINGKNYLMGLFRDVTEKKRAEEKLKESEEKYRTLVENAGDFIYLIDKNNKVLSLNIAAARLFRKEPKEVLNKSIFELFPKEMAIHFSKNIKKVLKTGKSQISETKLAANGKILWISANLTPVRDYAGEIVSVLGITRDLTERKMTEEKLEQQKEKYEKEVRELKKRLKREE